jgi:hypothetical protein
MKTVIASVREAIHLAAEEKADCFVASAPRNDGDAFVLSQRDAPEVFQKLFRPKIERARGMPGAQCTHSLVRLR